MPKNARGGAVAIAAAVVLGLATGVLAGRAALATAQPAFSCGNPSRFPRDEAPAVSPDKTKVAFVRTFDWGTPTEVSWIVLRELTGRRREHVIGQGAGVAWSPDGRELAVVRNESSSHALMRVALADRRVTQVASGSGSAYGVSWSPDGRRLLYVNQPDRSVSILVAVPREGGASVILDRSAVRAAAWSPDGSAIAVLENFDAIRLLRPDGRPIRSIPLEGEDPSVEGWLAWSPDGKQLAFSAEERPQAGYHLYVAGADGRTLRVLPDTAEAGAPQWSSDGRWILYSVADRALAQLYLVRPDGTEQHALPARGRSEDITPRYGFLRRGHAWSGSSRIVFTAYRPGGAYRRNFEVHSIDVDGRNERRITYHCQFGSPKSDVALTGTYLTDVIHGRGGSDRIDAGPASDVVDAGPGHDVVVLNDGERDAADCGPGRDTVVADRVDRLRRCERVRVP